jgi:opacity protein-like surface antigen
MKNILLVMVILVALLGCVSPQVVTCPTAPQDVIAHCQSISGQINHASSGNTMYHKGLALSSGGGTTTRGVNQFEYMRCMKQFGYNCQFEEMFPSSTGGYRTEPTTIQKPSTNTTVRPLVPEN